MRLRPHAELLGTVSDRVRHSCSSRHPDAAQTARGTPSARVPPSCNTATRLQHTLDVWLRWPPEWPLRQLRLQEQLLLRCGRLGAPTPASAGTQRRLRPLKRPFGTASDRVRRSRSSLHPDAAPPAQSAEQQHCGTSSGSDRSAHDCYVAGDRVRPQSFHLAPGCSAACTRHYELWLLYHCSRHCACWQLWHNRNQSLQTAANNCHADDNLISSQLGDSTLWRSWPPRYRNLKPGSSRSRSSFTR